jgi:REP element-mobilizing transposase RayT
MSTPQGLRRKCIRLEPSAYRESGRVFFVTVAISHHPPVFADRSFALECIELLQQVTGQRQVKVFAFCLMPDHAHILVECTL